MNKRKYRSEFSMRHLMRVFKLCDPANSGRININHLQQLARTYVDDLQEIDGFLRQLDPLGRGSLTFQEFSYGVKSLLRRRKLSGLWSLYMCDFSPQHNLNILQSMMSPITAATEDPATGNGSAGPEPRFVLSPPESPQLTDANKSQCSSLSDAENYECYGEGADIDLDSGISTDRIPGDGLQTSPLTNGIKRHTWLRTSLRRSPSNNNQENLPNRRWGSFRHSGKRQLGSNALARDLCNLFILDFSQLYRSSSFNSSGRSSTCDTADDMYSDASLEEDVLDLNNKFQLLQQQVGYLQDSANHNDERYTRAKADNAALQARVIMLEEQLRDAEMRYEDRLQDEQRRSKELMLRVEREKQLQLENANIRLQSAEAESASMKQEVTRQRIRLEKLEADRQEYCDQIQDLKHELEICKENESLFKEQEKRLIQDEEAHTHLIKDLSHEVERLRSEARTPALPTTSPETLRLEELHEEMAVLRDKNNQLREANEELQANLLTAGVEQGRLLTAGETSLAAELEAMTHDQIQQALKEQQDVNIQLRAYIDGILLNIVENYPQLLEVKRKPV
ncbi:hypothetical protein RI129_008674 [Pyrocoelia pectoralis]|uniref:Rab11 family-interacting protein 4A n=1 Tax=Pyrocoelia pectoralis TaxID=417401 RepID=A0AAN7V7R3_9COLE